MSLKIQLLCTVRISLDSLQHRQLVAHLQQAGRLTFDIAGKGFCCPKKVLSRWRRKHHRLHLAKNSNNTPQEATETTSTLRIPHTPRIPHTHTSHHQANTATQLVPTRRKPLKHHAHLQSLQKNTLQHQAHHKAKNKPAEKTSMPVCCCLCLSSKRLHVYSLDAPWLRLGCALVAPWLRLGCVLVACWLRVGCVLAASWPRVQPALQHVLKALKVLRVQVLDKLCSMIHLGCI